MSRLAKIAFDAEVYLTSAGLGRRIITRLGSQTFFTQGGAANAVLYLQSGRAKLNVVSKKGKEATITYLTAGEFVGEESLASANELHKSTFICITDCSALKIQRKEMIRVLHKEQSFSKIFTTFLLARAVRLQSDLVDQLFGSSERRLASALLLMAKIGGPDESEWLDAEITEESLAKLIGTRLSNVRFILQNLREHGLIDYDGRIRVRKDLLSMLLHDRMPGDNTAKPAIFDTLRRQSQPATHVPIESSIH